MSGSVPAPHAPQEGELFAITRRLEFDAGHRIPDHRSLCRHVHGHRYVLEVTLVGTLDETPGSPERGMVMDFGDVKRIAWDHLIGHWDHAFLAWRDDPVAAAIASVLPHHRTVLLDSIPTAENLARIAFETLAPHFHARYGERLRLARVRIFETPNCWADFPLEIT
jgi:6-pyruvoyltetrahydropterin/6-carboxytetrahydropterin synthase